ncbi:MAG: Co2+/Mg2+ efflux protein ApaG [Chromatiales bacterium]|nr:MAG: Co2+/Mg2+ efflux protein ApaG [Chromatiales bacterium]
MTDGHQAGEIRIEVQTAYLPDQSEPEESRYLFSYTISIHNEGALPAQLLTRRWLITDANGKVQEVRGDGVVGEQPKIPPGKMHRYSSGAVLETPVGTMEGSYGMISDDGDQFEAAIPRFRLAVPGILN